MHETVKITMTMTVTTQQAGGSSGGPARAEAPSAAEMARIDAQLELAAKKAALAGMERAAAQGGDVAPATAAPAAPLPPGERVIVIQDGDKVTTLTNPTPEQLAQVGIGAPAELPPDPRMIVTLTMATLSAIVLITWMVLNYLKRPRGAGAAKPDHDAASRMVRIENAVESIAVEVERISEAQRYTSRLLTEGAPNALPTTADAPGSLDALLQNRGTR